jgi:hypothetical protein
LSRNCGKGPNPNPKTFGATIFAQAFMDDANCVRSSLAEVKRAHARSDHPHRAAPLSHAAEDRPDE